MKNQPKNEYFWLNKLGIEIKWEGKIPYVTAKQLKNVLNKKEMSKFSEYFGIQTGIKAKNGDLGFFTYDIEAVLVRIFEKGRLTGTQKWMD